ncbi:unnamed protein product [Rotaria socialis]
MEVIQVAQYESETSDEEIIKENHDINEQRKKSKFWVKESTFDKPSETEALIENQWSKHYTNYTENGRKVYYRCNKVKRRGPQCSASMCLLYHADSDKVTCYKTEAEHDHYDHKGRGIDGNVKKIIEELYNDGVIKPKQIIRALEARKIKTPTYTQLNNYLYIKLSLYQTYIK